MSKAETYPVLDSTQAFGLGLSVNYLKIFSWLFLLLIAQLIRHGFLEIFNRSSGGKDWHATAAVDIDFLSMLISLFLLTSVLSVILRYLIFSPWPIYERAFKNENLCSGLSTVTGLDIMTSAVYFLVLFVVSYMTVNATVRPGMLFFSLLALPLLDTVMAVCIIVATFMIKVTKKVLVLRRLDRELGRVDSDPKSDKIPEPVLALLRAYRRIPDAKNAFNDQRFWEANAVDIVCVLLALAPWYQYYETTWLAITSLRPQSICPFDIDGEVFCAQIEAIDNIGTGMGLSLAFFLSMATIINVYRSRDVYSRMFRVLFKRRKVEEIWLNSERMENPAA